MLVRQAGIQMEPLSYIDWQQGLEADIAILRAAYARPRAIALRLEDAKRAAASGKKGYGAWPEFRACGRGTSSQYFDLGQRFVSLVFRHDKYAQEVYQHVKSLASKFTVIVDVSYAKMNKGDGAIITLKLANYAT